MTQIVDVQPRFVNGEMVYYESQLGSVSSGANKVAGAAAMVATVALYVPAPAGPVIAAVAGIVAGAAALIGKLFNQDKANAYKAEREGFEKAIIEIKSQNLEVDTKITQLQSGLNKINSDLKKQGFSGFGSINEGLGFCVIGCKKKKESGRLNNAKDEYARVLNEQAQKQATLQALITEYNTIVTRLYNLSQGKKVNNMVLYGAGGLALVVVGILIFKK